VGCAACLACPVACVPRCLRVRPCPCMPGAHRGWAGQGLKQRAGTAVISSLPQPIVAVPAYLFVEWFTFLLPIGLGCAAGTMIWMVFAELIPDGLFCPPLPPFLAASPGACAARGACAQT